jgi:hypothetical protein
VFSVTAIPDTFLKGANLSKIGPIQVH